MRSDQDFAEAILAWVVEACADIEGPGGSVGIVGQYDHAVSGKDQGLPDAVVEIERSATAREDERFPYAQLQQVLLRIAEAEVSVMVENTDPGEAAHFLRAVSTRLQEQALADATLGGRVFLTSDQIEADYMPQFVQYDDGTVGRQVTVRIAVAEMVNQ